MDWSIGKDGLELVGGARGVIGVAGGRNGRCVVRVGGGISWVVDVWVANVGYSLAVV